jgi:hypothetical protein
MTRRSIAAGLVALAVGAALTASAADAKPRSGNNPPSFVDMNDDGKYTNKIDLVVERVGGGLRIREGGHLVTGSAMGTTFLMVGVGHDLYINRNITGPNLVIVNRGGDIHIADGVAIHSNGRAFAVATRDRSGNNSAGALNIGKGVEIAQTYNGRGNAQVQIEAADLTVGASATITSTSGSSARGADTAQNPNAYLRGTKSLTIDPSAIIVGLQQIGPNG